MTLSKLTFGMAALAAAMSFGTSPSAAYGDAPWCAVINIGQGTVYWDCQYRTFEACYHLGNILARLLQFEPVAGTVSGSPLQTAETPRAILISARDRNEHRQAAGLAARLCCNQILSTH